MATADTPSAATVALAADMLFASRIRGAADATGVPVRIVTSASAAADAVRAGAGRLLLDLDLRSADPIVLIEQLRAEASTADIDIIAFVSHVREDRIAAARAAGATRVMARSAFVRDLPRLLTGPGDSSG